MAGNNSFMTSLLALLDKDNIMKGVTSKPGIGRNRVGVEYYLHLVEEILDLEVNQGQSKSLPSFFPKKPDPLSSTINELCGQITCKALHTNNVSQTMESLLDKLSSYSWDAKAVLTLSALTVYYAENWHLAQNEKSDPKLGLAAVLRGPRAGKLDSVALKDLMRVTLEFTKCTVKFASSHKDFRKLPASIDIRACFYCIIVSVLGCSVLCSGMISASNEFLWLDVSPFSKRVKEIHESFKKDVEDFEKENEKKLQYNKFKELCGSAADIVEIVDVLFCTEKDSPAVYQGLKKTTVKVEELRNKSLFLLISDLNLSNEDLEVLKAVHEASNFDSRNYGIMWVPIVDEHNKETQKKFLDMRSRMQWYTCNSMVREMAARFIREKWRFRQQTKVVVLNQQGKVENMDAMMMIRLWGSKALPFTRKRGDNLWEEHRNNWLKLVVDNSFKDEELIFLYGSAEDSKIVKEIEQYQPKMRSYVSFTNFHSNTKSKQFLARLESCISLEMQGNKEMPDRLVLELLELYTTYKKQSGLAIFARGSSVIVNTSFTDLLKVLSEHENWIKKVTNPKDFHTHFLDYYRKVIVKPQCYELSIPNMVSNIPECIECPTANCTRNMEIVITFRCCHGAH